MQTIYLPKTDPTHEQCPVKDENVSQKWHFYGIPRGGAKGEGVT